MNLTLKFLTSILLLFVSTISLSQEKKETEQNKQKFTLSGNISDRNNNESLIGVNVYIPKLKTGVTTNEYGFYSITIPKGSYTIQISSVGFQTLEQTISLEKNSKLNFKLSANEEQLQEVTVTDSRKATNIRKAEMSVNKLSCFFLRGRSTLFLDLDE